MHSEVKFSTLLYLSKTREHFNPSLLPVWCEHQKIQGGQTLFIATEQEPLFEAAGIVWWDPQTTPPKALLNAIPLIQYRPTGALKFFELWPLLSRYTEKQKIIGVTYSLEGDGFYLDQNFKKIPRPQNSHDCYLESELCLTPSFVDTPPVASSYCPISAQTIAAKIVNRTPCLFLDRDGIVIEDCGYPYKRNHLKIMDGIVEIIQWARREGMKVIVLSNQAGIAKGIFQVEDYENFTRDLQSELVKLNAGIDAWYSCPFHPQGTNLAYAKDSLLRKPYPGMLLQALSADFAIDLCRSIMIGDKPSDRLWMPGLRCLLLRGRYDLSDASSDAFGSLQDILGCLQQWNCKRSQVGQKSLSQD